MEKTRDIPLGVSTKFLSTKEAANWSGLSEDWFRKIRGTGCGPRYAKVGRRCLYDISDLVEYFEARKRA